MMPRTTALISLPAAMLMSVAGASGQSSACPQELAVYTEVGGGSQLEFGPNPGIFLAANVFRLLIPDGAVLEGNILWNNGVSRPNGILMLDCPDGDVTGEELDACTYWEGVVYAVSDDGEVDFIPPEGEAAARSLLFPDISRTLYYSRLNDGEADLPGSDVFLLSGCQE